MPTSHSRIGLVADPLVDRALAVFSKPESPIPRRATVARDAVLQGAVLEALEMEAREGGPNALAAAEVLASIEEILPSLGFPKELVEHFARKVSPAIELSHREERRRRLLHLIENPGPGEQLAQQIAEELDDRELTGF